METLAWRKASACTSSGNCVEIARYPAGSVLAGWVAVRDSKHPAGPILEFTPDEWDGFLEGVRRGEFDPPTVGS